MGKIGFVYIWRDRKHKRYYLGCHWGTEDDEYICSSRWMRNSYKRRPQDFKRRILEYVYNKNDLLEIEYKWLSLIKENELGIKYYNISKRKFNHWSASDNAKSIGQKISNAHKNHPDWGYWGRGKVLSEETKQKLREANAKQFENLEQREIRRKKSLELWADPEYRNKQIEQRKKPRKPLSEETKLKISMSQKGIPRGPMSEEQKIKQRANWKNQWTKT